ncbi:MAG: HEAT repeat domain-containing protein [Planctomycetota bacterium]|jgi:HEAT repeat protein
MTNMRPWVLVLLCVVGCASTDDKEVTNIVEVGGGAVEQRPEIVTSEAAKLVRNTEQSVKRYEELRLQGLTRAQIALRDSIATNVDQDFDVFRDMALEGKLYLHRNMAVKCIGFAREKMPDAREALLLIAGKPNEQPFLRANAMRALGVLRDPDTPLEPIVSMLGSGNPAMRTEAAETFKELALVKKTPRELSPQYHTAIERLATMLYDKSNRAGRRAAVWALANLRHPDTLEHLLAALSDPDEQVQIGALRGLELLGDQRAIEPLIEYLRDGPGSSAKSWTILALQAIAVQGGFAKDPAVLIPLGSSHRKWDEFFRAARMK